MYAIVNEKGEYVGSTEIKEISDIPMPNFGFLNEKIKWDFKSKKWKYSLIKEKELKASKNLKIDKIYGNVLGYFARCIPCKNGTKRFKHDGKIDVLIPLYKKEKYIKRCLDSIQRQTRLDLIEKVYILSQTKADFDAVEKIKNIYSFKINNIMFRGIRRNASRARNILVKKAKSNWISFIDADDYFFDDFFEMFVEYNKDSAIMKPIGLYDNSEIYNKDRLMTFNRWRYFYFTFDNLTGIYHKSIFKKYKLKEKYAKGGEDFDFLLRVYFAKKYYITLHKKFYMYTHDDQEQLTSKKTFLDTHRKVFIKDLKFFKDAFKDYMMIKNEDYKYITQILPREQEKEYKKVENEIKKEIIQLFQKNVDRSKRIDLFFDKNFEVKLNSLCNTDKTNEISNFIKNNSFVDVLKKYNCGYTFTDIPRSVIDYVICDKKVWKYFKCCNKIEKINKILSNRENKDLEITFELPIPCNKHCSYCFQKNNKIKKDYSEEEILSALKLRLKQCEKIAKRDKVKLIPKIMGGEVSILPDDFAEKILSVFNNYNNIIIFSNGANRESPFYNTNERIITHVMSKEEIEELKSVRKANESFSYIFGKNELQKVEEMKETEKNIIPSMDRYQMDENRHRENIYEIPMKAIDVMSGDVVPCWKLGIEKVNIKNIKSFRKMKVGCNKPCDNCIVYSL